MGCGVGIFGLLFPDLGFESGGALFLGWWLDEREGEWVEKGDEGNADLSRAKQIPTTLTQI